ncbi:MAG: hypothetical protein MJ002_08860 [Paludibacteraceae bacterium]|nr:hypothetical protein [Paludibacteraceae bacterium]
MTYTPNFATNQTSITLANTGDKVYFKAKGTNDKLAKNTSSHNRFSATGGDVEVSGNIMYLLNGSTPATFLSSIYAFAHLFDGMSNLKDAKDLILPAGALLGHCYQSMFENCSNLENAPELPAKTLMNDYYNAMFKGCKKLQKVTMLATSVNASNAMTDWLTDAGTEANNPTVYVASGMATNIQVPDGWTVTEVSSQP